MEEEIEGPGRVCKWWFGQETTQHQLRGFYSLPCSLPCAIVGKWSLLPPHSVCCQCCEKKSQEEGTIFLHPSLWVLARQNLQGEIRLQRNQIMVRVPHWVRHPEQMVQWQHQASKKAHKMGTCLCQSDETTVTFQATGYCRVSVVTGWPLSNASNSFTDRKTWLAVNGLSITSLHVMMN